MKTFLKILGWLLVISIAIAFLAGYFAVLWHEGDRKVKEQRERQELLEKCCRIDKECIDIFRSK